MKGYSVARGPGPSSLSLLFREWLAACRCGTTLFIPGTPRFTRGAWNRGSNPGCFIRRNPRLTFRVNAARQRGIEQDRKAAQLNNAKAIRAPMPHRIMGADNQDSIDSAEGRASRAGWLWPWARRLTQVPKINRKVRLRRSIAGGFENCPMLQPGIFFFEPFLIYTIIG